MLAGPLIGWLGPGLVLCVLPLVQVVGLIALVARAVARGADASCSSSARTATHGLTRPARELLFTVVTRDDKYRAKNAIDTIGYRLGDFGASWLGEGLAPRPVAARSSPASRCSASRWLVLAALLGAGFRRRATPDKETP